MKAPEAVQGWIYFIQPETGGPIKIGWCRYDARSRRTELNTGFPGTLVLLGAAPGTRDDEEAIHKRLAELEVRGEWFALGPDVKQVMQEVLGSLPESLKSGDFEYQRAPRKRTYSRPTDTEGPPCTDCGRPMGREPGKHWATCFPD